MSTVVRGLHEVSRSDIAQVGGKAANLGELTRLEGVQVPEGFCVTTAAFARVIAEAPGLQARIDALARLDPGETDGIRARSAELREHIEAIVLPDDIAEQITAALQHLGPEQPTAVRSSATAEDLPTASFAGQQDSALNVVGAPAVLRQISRCWASLFTERAVAYRLRQGLGRVQMAVLVQRLILPQAAGVLFTADPLTSNRKISRVEASFGLGEALVSGLVNPDRYTLRGGELVEVILGDKTLATGARPGGGTELEALSPDQRQRPVLTEAQLQRLERLGRRIEAHFGAPQDIEWCLRDETLFVVQSRPITTLFPIPDAGDSGKHVFLSVGHQQMMTDAMRPLGLSFFQLTAGRPMLEAGGRLFVDPTPQLASPASRDMLLRMVGLSDPPLRDALSALLQRGDFIEELPAPAGPGPAARPPAPPEPDPAIVPALIQRGQAAIEALRREIQSRTGTQLMDFILEDIQELKKQLTDPESFAATLSGMNAASWLNTQLQAWLGEKNPADILAQSAPNNISSEMGLALLDVADQLRPYPQVLAYLKEAQDSSFWEGLAGLDGGPEASAALSAYLERYGMRCAGEIDLSRPRWSERPSALFPILLSNIQAFEPGESRRRFERGLQAAHNKEQELLSRLRALPDGEQKAAETQRMIHRLRAFVGYREYPKYGIICRYLVYRQALLREAERLLQAQLIQDKEDIFFLSFQELHALLRTQSLDPQLILQRKAAHERNALLRPPQAITSDGEVLGGAARRAELPAGALVGLPASSGVVEGRARVLRAMSEAPLQAGDILVTPFTDPSWTPAFVVVRGLVTEVGGLTTHGAVIAREYGLPAVVGVERATERIRDGQQIRVNGAEGYVEILDAPSPVEGGLA